MPVTKSERMMGIQSRCWASVSFPVPSLYPFTPAGSPASGIICQHGHSHFCTCIFALVCVLKHTSTWPHAQPCIHRQFFLHRWDHNPCIFCFSFERVKTAASVVTNDEHDNYVPSPFAQPGFGVQIKHSPCCWALGQLQVPVCPVSMS